MNDKKYCYRYVAVNDSCGRPIIMLFSHVVIRETGKTFWHAHDFPHLTTEQIKQINFRSKGSIKRCLKDAARSSYHLTKEQALRAFVYRKMFQLQRMELTMETAKMCLDGLLNSGSISEGWHPATVIPFDGTSFVASEEIGPVASSFSWGEY